MLNNIKAFRRILLPLLRMTSRDISIRHPYTPSVRLSLNSFKHKGYWYFGKRREEKTMNLFARLIQPGAHVVEVGGHVGLISIYFMSLVGSNGQVTVFEPGSNNLPYIRRNLIAANKLVAKTNLIEKAVSDYIGETRFFEDPLTGQNNSAVPAFEGLKANAAAAFATATTSERTVKLTTLDSEFKKSRVNFIKIDVEGYKKAVVYGAQEIIENQKPVIMVEIQADEEELFEFFADRGWVMFRETAEKISDASQLRGNIFVLHKTAHALILKSIFHQEIGAP